RASALTAKPRMCSMSAGPSKKTCGSSMPQDKPFAMMLFLERVFTAETRRAQRKNSPRTPRLCGSVLFDAVQPRAVIPENLSARGAGDFHGHKIVHGVGPVRIRVRVVRRNHHVVVAQPPDHVEDQLFLHVHGDEALAQEVVARPQAHGLVAVALAHFPALVEA